MCAAPTPSPRAELQERVPNAGNLSLAVRQEHYHGWDPRRLHEVPMYAFAKVRVGGVGGANGFLQPAVVHMAGMHDSG